jgi:TRAP-type C4-dicarboxylate transport system substrate-binding protein
MRGMGTVLGAIALAAAFATVQAQDLQKLQFKVVGSFGNLSNWQKIEKPFWDALAKQSGGALSATAQSTTELGLKGTEVMGLLKREQVDFAHALPSYVAGDPWLEAVDLAGVARDLDMARKITTVWAPRLDALMDKTYNAKILNWYAFPMQMIYCKGAVRSLADLKGKKVRVQGISQGDLVEGFGATAVTLPFDDVVPALKNNTVDCAITGTMPAYKAGWHEVATHVIEMPLGFTIIYTAVSMTTWRKLDGRTREFLGAQMKAFEEKAWQLASDEMAMGLVCTTGLGGTCGEGKPGKLIKVQQPSGDFKIRELVMIDTVLKRWAKRCGGECVTLWNDTAGKISGMTAIR